MADGQERPAFLPEVVEAQRRVAEAGVAPGDALAQPIGEARAATRRYQAFLNAGGPEMARVEEVTVPGTAPPLRLRLYRPVPGEARLPVLLHVHGGGFAFGSLDALDRWKREIAAETGFAVAGLDYALSPEHVFPTALEQVLAALRWLRAAPGIDPDRIAVAGDSAGGNLALSALLRLRDAGEPMPRLGIIVYGMLSERHDTPSHRDFGDGSYGLSTARLAWFWDALLGGERDAARRRAAMPLHAEMAGLPPMLLIAAGLDPLLDDTSALDAKLAEAGVARELRVFPGVPHGFIAQTALLESARAARREVSAALRRHLGG